MGQFSAKLITILSFLRLISANSSTSPQLEIGFGKDIPILPPLVLLALCIVALVLTLIWPASVLPKKCLISRIDLRAVVIAPLTAASVYYILNIGSAALTEAGSGVAFTPVKGLATSGFPYGCSRNPLYVGLCLWLLPWLALIFNSAWFVAIMPAMFYYLNHVVIPSEEKFLSEHFGDEYAAYLSSVPRWLI